MHPEDPTLAPSTANLTDEHVVLYALGEADPKAASSITQRIAHDPALASRVRAAQAALQGLASLASFDASMQVSARQRAALTELMPAQRPSWLTNAADRAAEVALLVLDSLRTPGLTPGYRSVDPGEARLLRYDCLRGVIDLRVERDRITRDVALSGQVSTPEPVVSVRVRAHATGETVHEFDVGADGYFECTLSPAFYALELITDRHASSVIPSLDLRDGDPTIS